MRSTERRVGHHVFRGPKDRASNRIADATPGLQRLKVTGENRGLVGIVICSVSEPTLKVVGVDVGVVVVVKMERDGVFENFGEAQRNGSFPAARDGADADYHH